MSESDEEGFLLPVHNPPLRTIDHKSWKWKLVYLLALIVAVDLIVEVGKHQSKSFLTSGNLGVIYPHQDDLCDICDCTSNPPTLQKDRLIANPSRSMLPAFLQSTILNTQCSQVHTTAPIALNLLHKTLDRSEDMFAWNIAALEPEKSTAFMFTKTSPAGKTGTERAAYIQRHVDTIRLHEDSLRANVQYFDGVPITDRQLVWIVVEDNFELDQEVAAVLELSNLNYIYFAHGPTRSYGNAQHNAALSMVHALARSYLGDGPIVGVDDDAEIHPDLLQLIWKVKKAGIWPMGNLGPTGWEGPIVGADGKIKEWSGNNQWRQYPIDNGAFTFHSSLLGSEKLPGPAYWPTDLNGGESEFMERILESRDELEVLCESCHVAWHNHPLGVPHAPLLTYESGAKPW